MANYYGVGAYLRPLEDARRAGVRFAGECLAFANVPDEPAAATAGVPRDAGADWDFEDVRDHYLALVFGVDPVSLRSAEPDRYLELSRAVSGEVMAEVLGEWRRAGSPCQGALILWLRDLAPGAGWGVLDHRGEPKVAFAHLARALAPVAVWSTDEGLGGVDVHVANDRPGALAARLRVALYRGFEQLVDEVVVELELEAHGTHHPKRRGAAWAASSTSPGPTASARPARTSLPSASRRPPASCSRRRFASPPAGRSARQPRPSLGLEAMSSARRRATVLRVHQPQVRLRRPASRSPDGARPTTRSGWSRGTSGASLCGPPSAAGSRPPAQRCAPSTCAAVQVAGRSRRWGRRTE